MKTIYYTVKIAKYYFSVLQRDMKHYVRLSTTVNVIGETTNSYIIVLKQPILKHKVGDKMFVRKQHVCITQRADETEIWNDLWYNSNKF